MEVVMVEELGAENGGSEDAIYNIQFAFSFYSLTMKTENSPECFIFRLVNTAAYITNLLSSKPQTQPHPRSYKQQQ